MLESLKDAFHVARHALRIVEAGRSGGDRRGATLATDLERHAQRRPAHIFLRYEQQQFSYAQANALVNRHAHAYRALGIGRGDVVALMLDNRPAFLWHFFALQKLGAVGSLINTNLSGPALVHAVRICEPKRVTVGSELWGAFEEVRDDLADVVRGAADVDVDPEHPEQAPAIPAWGDRIAGAAETNPQDAEQPRLDDLCAYIYTSGTTGMPKAALIRNARMSMAARTWAALALRYRPRDVLYNCLPLYHSNGLMLGVGSALTAGVTVALARKFSRSRFWEDVRQHNATAFIYIGELCRYLMSAPPDAGDREHRVRAITGNGLRPDIWEEFQARFGIARIAEFYASTEGNAVTLNVFNRVGSVGPMLPGMALARWDEEEQRPLRGPKGFLVRPSLDQPGLLLGRIGQGGRSRFDGYHDKAATETKILRDAFEPGDAYFNSGDLLKLDRQRHLYFVDRLGDTFRWKGENVSTFEVQAQIASFPDASDVNVYGVPIPGTDGRAGMVAMVLKDESRFDPSALRAHVEQRLPAYARPLFVRLLPEMETTGTFKLKKHELQRQGFDPSTVSDPLYVLHPKQGTYVPLDAAVYGQISSQQLRF